MRRHDGDLDTGDLDAGDLGAWFAVLPAVLRGDVAADVACAGCTACCTSAQFVHVGPDETDTLARIPPELLAPAPGLPDGHRVLGYDEHGHCPMLGEAGCTIYEHRPRTCRTYDCRIFRVTGLDPADDGKDGVAERPRRWHFRTDEHSAARRDEVRREVQRLVATGAATDWSRTRLAVTAVAVVLPDADTSRS